MSKQCSTKHCKRSPDTLISCKTFKRCKAMRAYLCKSCIQLMFNHSFWLTIRVESLWFPDSKYYEEVDRFDIDHTFPLWVVMIQNEWNPGELIQDKADDTL